ncbi:mitochondrial adenine nucleotide transporter ADNT1-like [Papaver somniferum]|uniref:mitochondrial adenine nucleotide transporter ADNT1-like n=1 Tax=Papaver somniferum TaxID=3469 RepID=UPI000E705D96|nr:mitochondrial adenine nucleotide transporter ADNT1-like [Papaver somniferum]
MKKISALIVTATALSPLRRLEILFQVQNSRNIQYKDVAQGLKHMRRTDGFRGSYKGNGAYIAEAMSYSAVYLVVHYSLARIIGLDYQQPGKENAKPPILLTRGIHSCTVMIATAAAYPMDMAQGRLSVQTGKSPYQYRGIYHALTTIAREEGPRALYKGFLPYSIGQVVYTGLNFAVYEFTSLSIAKAVLSRFHELKSKGINPDVNEEVTTAIKKKLPYFRILSFAVCHTFAYPFNVIHQRMQMEGWKNSSSIIASCYGSSNNIAAATEFTGMCDAFKKTIRNNGFKALYKGSVPYLLLKVFPASLFACHTPGADGKWT